MYTVTTSTLLLEARLHLKRLLHGVTRNQLVVPPTFGTHTSTPRSDRVIKGHEDSRPDVRVLLRDAHVLERDQDRHAVPGNERDVRDRALSADEPLLFREHSVEHTEHALRFLLVALDRRGDLLRVEAYEPEGLAEVRAMT